MKVRIACCVFLLAGCGSAQLVQRKALKPKPDGAGISYVQASEAPQVEEKAEKYAPPPQSYSVRARNGAKPWQGLCLRSNASHCKER